ncbi:hypothetical protein Bbelb_188880 [Branchiostoma belcheri]|nr:hypothetical protein Bbelb_188880 [Branchiostoma belcheri]
MLISPARCHVDTEVWGDSAGGVVRKTTTGDPWLCVCGARSARRRDRDATTTCAMEDNFVQHLVKLPGSCYVISVVSAPALISDATTSKQLRYQDGRRYIHHDMSTNKMTELSSNGVTTLKVTTFHPEVTCANVNDLSPDESVTSLVKV